MASNVNNIPQVGRTRNSPESHPGNQPGCPVDSGGGRITPNRKKQKLSTVITPPKDGTESGKNVCVLDLTWNEEQATSMKRKIGSAPGTEMITTPRTKAMRLQGKLKQYIDKIDKEVRELYTMVREVPNTKREIRDIAWQMRSTMSLMTSRQIQELMEGCELDKATVEEKVSTNDNESQTDIPTATKKETRTFGTQTEESGPSRRWEREVTKEDLARINTTTEYKEIRDKRWPEKLFDKVKITVGNPLAAANESCTLIIVDQKDKGMSKYVQKMYGERYPELLVMNEEFEVMENITRRKTPDGKSMETTKYIIKITTDGTEDDLWEKTQKAKIFAEEKEIGDIRTHKLLDMDINTQRKMFQTIFCNGEIKIDMYTPGGPQGQQRQSQQKSGEGRKPPTYESEAIEIIQKGANYSDVLKEVKTSLGGQDVAKGIRTIRSTKTGSLLVVLDKDKKDVEELRRTIATKMPQCQLRGYGQKEKDRMKPLFIRNMEGTVTQEEVTEALNNMLREYPEAKVEVGTVRPSRFDTATVTVRTTSDVAKVLLERGMIQVGISEGKIEERFDVIRCHRCWGYGHMARDCGAETDRRTDCYRCGKPGHKVAECEEETQCPLCNKKEHKAGGIGCKAKMHAISRPRINSAKNTGHTPRSDANERKDRGKSPTIDDEVFDPQEATGSTPTTK